MSQSPTSRREDRMLAVAAYITLVAVSVISLINMQRLGAPWELAVVLLLAFGVLLSRVPQPGASPWRIHLHIGIQGGLVAALMALVPRRLSERALCC